MSDLIVSICDNAAATGDYHKLDALSLRWEKRSARSKHAKMCEICYCVSQIFLFRSSAIRCRLQGQIADALRFERFAEYTAIDLSLYKV